MPEEQVAESPPEEPGSGPADAQPEGGPSTEAATAAAEPSGPQGRPGAAEDVLAAREQKRLSRLQAAKDRQIGEAERQAREAREKAEALESQLTELRMQGMTEQDRAKFLQERQAEQLAEERRALQRERAEFLEERNLNFWLQRYASRGVPMEVLEEALDSAPRREQAFAAMEDASWEYLTKQSQGSPETPSAPAAPPPVGPSDQVQAGGTGAPPSREIDKLIAEGKGPGTPDFRQYIKDQRRRRAKELK